MIEILAALTAFALSFLGLGFLWIGKLGGEAIVAALYLWLAYSVSHLRGKRIALMTVAAPAVPIAALLVQFRDSNDSHLVSIAIVLGWLAGITLGAFAADPLRTSYRRLLACIAGTSVLHLAATITLILSSFGSGMQRFDGKPAAGTTAIDALTEILIRPLMSIIGDGGARLSPAMQWLALAANSLTWGVWLGVLLACALRFGRRNIVQSS